MFPKSFVLAACIAALFGTATAAQAGAPVRSPNGKGFLVLQFKVFPPRAGAGVAAEFDSFSGNDVDGSAPATNDQTRTIAVRLARARRSTAPRSRPAPWPTPSETGARAPRRWARARRRPTRGRRSPRRSKPG